MPGFTGNNNMTPPQMNKPSPIHESSLRQARERVEMRLRKQYEKRRQNESHSRTLELARQLAAEGVRKRQAQWASEHDKSNTATLRTRAEPKQGQRPAPAVDAITKTQKSAHFKAPAHRKGSAQKRQTTSGSATLRNNLSSRSRVAKSQAVSPQTDKEEINGRVVGKRFSPEKKRATTSKVITIGPRPQRDPAQSADADTTSILPTSDQREEIAASAPAAAHRFAVKPASRGLMRLLSAVAWLILGVGIMGAILSWATMGDVQAGMQGSLVSGPKAMPMGLLLGFAYLATGVLGFSFFWMASLISNQLKDIRRILLLQVMRPDEADKSSK